MVKRQKEKQYLSATEQKAQGRSRSNKHVPGGNSTGVVQRALPFNCCALTLTPFENPVCTILDTPVTNTTATTSTNSSPKTNNYTYGIMFDNAALMEYVFQHKKNPVTGKTLTPSNNNKNKNKNSNNIITLHMDRDTESGKWQCPILTKVFTDRTKIVAVLGDKTKKHAYVYSYEAYSELNLKQKNYFDLTTGYKFSPKNGDVLILNDPDNMHFQQEIRDISTFWHIQHARTARKQQQSSTTKHGNGGEHKNTDIRKTVTAERVMEQLRKEQHQRAEDLVKKKKEHKKREQQVCQESKLKNAQTNYTFDVVYPTEILSFPIPAVDVTGVSYTTGMDSGGFTSTADDTTNTSTNTNTNMRVATKEEILAAQCSVMKSKSMKGKKGYVRMFVEIRNTSYYNNTDEDDDDTKRKNNNRRSMIVPLLLELHCDIVPKTCTNFLGLCRRKRYNGTIFHRYIPNFMIQGGGEKMKQQQQHEKGASKDTSTSILDTSNTSSTSSKNKFNQDATLWGLEPFEDEFDPRLKHNHIGMVCMANAGPNTNKQQFYITLNDTLPHLDRKHTVFGQVVEGLAELQSAMLTKSTYKVKTNSKDSPILDILDTKTGEKSITHAVIVIVATEVLDDPAQIAQKKEEERLTKLHQNRMMVLQEKQQLELNNKRKRQDEDDKLDKNTLNGSAISSSSSVTASSSSKVTTKTTSSGIGKYLSEKVCRNNTTNNNKADNDDGSLLLLPSSSSSATMAGAGGVGLPTFGGSTEVAASSSQTKKNKKSKQQTTTKFGNFSSW